MGVRIENRPFLLLLRLPIFKTSGVLPAPTPVANACNPSAWKVETRESEVQSHSWLCSRFKASLSSCVASISKQNRTKIPSAWPEGEANLSKRPWFNPWYCKQQQRKSQSKIKTTSGPFFFQLLRRKTGMVRGNWPCGPVARFRL